MKRHTRKLSGGPNSVTSPMQGGRRLSGGRGFRLRMYHITTAVLTASLILPLKQTTSVSADPPASPTYYRNVQPIVVEHCVSCHNPGGSAPFSLRAYHDVEKRSQQIAQITKAACMPPWKPDSHGELVGENRLTSTEIALLQQWADQGAPAGQATTHAASAPIPGNALGKPDAVLTPSAPFQLRSEGPDLYRCFVLPTSFGRDVYLRALVFQPGNPAAADHALEYADAQRRVRFMNSVSSGEGFTVQGSAIGLQPATLIGAWGNATPQLPFPQGSGVLLPKDADIILEVHYHPTGKPEADLPHLLLYLAKGTVTRRVRIAPVLASSLKLPPNFSELHASGQSPVVSDISVLSIVPYLRHHGTAIALDALLPDKSQKTIITIPQWDFGWIGNYRFVKPLHIPAGSILTMAASFTTADPGNSNPISGDGPVVSWGDTTQDENAVAYVFYTTDAEIVGRRSISGIPDAGEQTQAAMNRILLKMFDTNHDGTIEKREQIQMGNYFHGGLPSMAGMEM